MGGRYYHVTGSLGPVGRKRYPDISCNGKVPRLHRSHDLRSYTLFLGPLLSTGCCCHTYCINLDSRWNQISWRLPPEYLTPFSRSFSVWFVEKDLILKNKRVELQYKRKSSLLLSSADKTRFSEKLGLVSKRDTGRR